MQEIHTPLTPQEVFTRVEHAVAAAQIAGQDYSEARQRVLHACLRNCIWTNNVECMQGIIQGSHAIDLDSNFDRGPLLVYAAWPAILAQHVSSLAPVRILLENHANPIMEQRYSLSVPTFGNPTPVFQTGSFVDYLSRVINHVNGTAPDAELALTIDGREDQVTESIGFIKRQLIRRDPEIVLGMPWTPPSAAVRGISEASGFVRRAPMPIRTGGSFVGAPDGSAQGPSVQ